MHDQVRVYEVGCNELPDNRASVKKREKNFQGNNNCGNVKSNDNMGHSCSYAKKKADSYSKNSGSLNQSKQNSPQTLLGMRSGRRANIIQSGTNIYYPTLRVEVKEAKDIWLSGYILKIEKGKLLITFENFSDKCDRWIDCDNNGIRVASEQKDMSKYLSERSIYKENITISNYPLKKSDSTEISHMDVTVKEKNNKKTIRASNSKIVKSDEYNSSYYKCKLPHKKYIPYIDKIITEYKKKKPRRKNIQIVDIRRDKFKINYRSANGRAISYWIPLLPKGSIKKEKPSIPIPIATPVKKDDTLSKNENTNDQYDRYTLLKAAGVSLRAVAAPEARIIYNERLNDYTNSQLVKLKSIYIVGSRVGILIYPEYITYAIILKTKYDTLKLKPLDDDTEKSRWISIFHKSITFISGPTEESLEMVAMYEEEEINKRYGNFVLANEILKDPTKWEINCNVCKRTLITKRLYCTYCESEYNDLNGQSFDLCLNCFNDKFPEDHEHPKSSFAMETLDNPVPQGIKIITDGIEVFHKEYLVTDVTTQSYLINSKYPSYEYRMTTVYCPAYAFSNILSACKGDYMLRVDSLRPDVPRCVLCLGIGSDVPDIYAPDSSVKYPPPSAPFVSTHPFTLHRPKIKSNCKFNEYQNDLLSGNNSPYVADKCDNIPVSKRHSRSNSNVGDEYVTYNDDEKISSIKRVIWIHLACAKYSPVSYYNNGDWYNILELVAHGRKMIGCFEKKCNRCYHLHCTGKPLKYFENGIIYRCPRHELVLADTDVYIDKVSCDICEIKIKMGQSWHSCKKCLDSYFETFDVCMNCYEFISSYANSSETCPSTTVFQNEKTLKLENWAKHNLMHSGFECFYINAYKSFQDEKVKSRKSALEAWEKHRSLKPGKKYNKVKIKSAVARCIYCWKEVGPSYRRGYYNTTLCQECFEFAGKAAIPAQAGENKHDSNVNGSVDLSFYKADAGDYCHKHYLTRKYVEMTNTSASISNTKNEKKELMTGENSTNTSIYFSKQKSRNDRNYSNLVLASYAPLSNHYYSLILFTSFYDIPGRVPRWATHSGSDYHGTWIPQIVRISLLKYTKVNDRILSNFSGRGTDSVECFLLKRRSVAVDINQSSVYLSQKNVSFALSPESNTSAAYMPLIIKGDARNLEGSIFLDKSFDHILSHPPYKDCISFSNGMIGDLSQISDENKFQDEMLTVALESKRLLKQYRRLTLVIGDNRKECYYQLVAFSTIKTYMQAGFEVEELVMKRQRHCRAAPLGVYLCRNYDFLMMTHEVLAILRKNPPDAEQINKSIINLNIASNNDIKCTPEKCGFNTISNCSWYNFNMPVARITFRMIPNFINNRRAVSMGTIWVVDSNDKFTLSDLIVSKIVERYGRNNECWEEIRYPDLFHKIMSEVEYVDYCYEKYERKMSSDECVVSKKVHDTFRKDSERLFQMGLKLDLKSEGEDDSVHYIHMNSEKFLLKENTSHTEHPALIVIPNFDIPPSAITTACWINVYRKEIINRVSYSLNKVIDNGFVAIGIKDVRVKSDKFKYLSRSAYRKSHLVPLSIIVADDIENLVPEVKCGKFRLKDFICGVPSGYQCQKYTDEKCKEMFNDDIKTWDSENDEELNAIDNGTYIENGRISYPTIHAVYLVYTKNRYYQEPGGYPTP